MKQRTPISSRKWKDITDFDLKVLSVVIITLSLITITLVLYTFYLKVQKSKVEVVIREVGTNTTPPTERVLKTATQTVIILEPAKEATSLAVPIDTATTGASTQVNQQTAGQEIKKDENSQMIKLETENTESTNVNVQQPQKQSQEQNTQAQAKDEKQEPQQPVTNTYLKDITKFDYNLLVSRMAENFPESALRTVYLYAVDGETALKIAKLTQNYVIDRSGSKYYVLTLNNVMPELNPSRSIYTITTDPISSSKDAFKSVVNLRTVGISAFSISAKSGYIICLGIFTSENQAKSFYYSQDWTELSRYGHVKGAKVSKIGQ
ncbi:hypothetical protein MNL76_03090 [Fervidobacterium riparium]|uniref:hypothetical protein n=1 Tax=Fervidobacterium gondwanense TaxID=44754 RepID=UPI002201E917|nr:hypothetical protein IB67_00720 [Fervidobacterium riparium]